MRTKKFLFKK